MPYLVTRAAGTPDISRDYNSADWKNVPAIHLNFRYPTPGDYHPPVEFRLQYDDEALYGLFEVTDRAIRCVAEKYQDPVCEDSCVEFFVEPANGIGYINFEVNASGVLLSYHIVDPERTPDGFKDHRPITEEQKQGMEIFHTLPDKVEPEINVPTTYRVGWKIPFSVFTKVMGVPAPKKGDVWRANVFKCGDSTSLPHWLCWSPVEVLNFHTPQYFDKIIFG